MFALLWYIDWSSIRRKLMIVHTTESTASGFSTAFPSCKCEDQLVWILLVSIRDTPGPELRHLESRNVLYCQVPFKWEKKCFLVLPANSSFTERSKLSQWHDVIQLNAVLHVRTRLFHFLTTCGERCAPNTCPAPPAASAPFSPPLEAAIPGDNKSLW